ncbi:MAG: ATP-binding cassette domain-containing protein [Bacteriovoracales bacterium]|nr:ATP-binding cassette domain-containing protein [Bacteriovoracales bacterium]
MAVHCVDITKNFKTYKKFEGLKGSFKSLFVREHIINPAILNFDLSIEPGEIVALLGPNGSGKTTLMKMLTGIIVPSSGQVTVCDHIPFQREKEFRKKISLVMGQKSQLWWDIPAMDSFKLLQRYYEIEEVPFKRRMDELTETLGVQNYLHIHVRKLSLGERMKLELMASLLHAPEIIFLDEPTIGLDLMAQENIREFIRAYHKEHKSTILLTSHYMADVEALCERLIFIFKGKKYFDGELSQFANIFGRKKGVNFIFQSPQNKNHPFWQDYEATWNEQGTQVKLYLGTAQLREISRKILADYPVIDFFTEELAIERVMKKLIKNPEILQSEIPRDDK